MRLKNKPLVSLIRIWLHSRFPPFLSLPVFLLLRSVIPLTWIWFLICLSFSASIFPLFSLSHSLLSCLSGGNPIEQPVIERTSHSGGRLINKPKTCLPLYVTFLAEQKVISFPILASLTTVRDLERCYWSAAVFSALLFHTSYWKCQMLSDFCGGREGKCCKLRSLQGTILTPKTGINRSQMLQGLQKSALLHVHFPIFGLFLHISCYLWVLISFKMTL